MLRPDSTVQDKAQKENKKKASKQARARLIEEAEEDEESSFCTSTWHWKAFGSGCAE